MFRFLILLAILMLPIHANADDGFVVLELFTSEGCSSCPAADQILSDYHNRAETLGIKIITISHHVDYWNYLGWEDPFSTKYASQRQRAYATLLSRGSAFTPQLIINGELSIVGSDRNSISKAIHTQLKGTKNILSFQTIETKENELTLKYSVKEAIDDSEILFLIVGEPKESNVTSGENKGRILSHSNTVISYQKPQHTKVGENSYRFSPTQNESFKNISLQAVLQSNKTMKIFGSDEIALPELK